MVKPVTTGREAFVELLELVAILDDRLERLENQNLHLRLERAEELAKARAVDLQSQLTRLAEVVADLATR